MEILRAFTYRLKPTPDQADAMAWTAGVTRLVYNLALERQALCGRRLAEFLRDGDVARTL